MSHELWRTAHPRDVNSSVDWRILLYSGTTSQKDFLIEVHDKPIPPLTGLGEQRDRLSLDQVLYRLPDVIAELWLPVVDGRESIDRFQDQVTQIRRSILQLRRVLGGTRHAVFQLRHTSNTIIGQDLCPFVRDVHDVPTIHLETITGVRGGYPPAIQSCVACQGLSGF